MEVHMSNIFSRGGWHTESAFSEMAIGHVIGLKDAVYELGLRGMKQYLDGKTAEINVRGANG
ncbi:type II 3-dehydroquinate dehydratase [Paenibacillus ferrarius]|uniref:type II 3-dehydroquinate dehydratase n=1 Tax=Paenibacillus ferrarius TaxID=1469647 RepID=UPI00244751C2|nr:type II 3-dehydroquinate dehydratase [Paenibacillus ferrarius]